MKVDRILAVLNASPAAQWSENDPLIRRAVDVARHFHAAVTLLDVCHDNALTYGALVPRSEIDRGRQAIIDASREQTQTLAAQLTRSYGLSVAADVRWDHDRSNCIQDAAETAEADLIIKERGDNSFLLGLFSTTDWDLLRESDRPVWFVSPESSSEISGGVVAAVDATMEEAGPEDRLLLDHQAFSCAKHLSDLFSAPLYVVHAYSVPRNLTGYAGYLPTLLPDLPVSTRVTASIADSDRELREQIASRHADAIRTFVDEHGIPLDDLIVAEGPVDAVLRATAEQHSAGLIVMGADQKGRWDRLLGHVSAEPTLAEARCDVLFVKSVDARERVESRDGTAEQAAVTAGQRNAAT